MMTPLAAAKAYATTQGSAAPGLGGAAPTQGKDFGDLLQSVMTDAVQTSKNAETQIAKQVQGKAELIDVVTAISSAEASLETVMAVRDQVIAAYQEIMRMPI
ncbi:flagellar hook-basal body complex protein FliE [Caulobacter mirabilis]|uniref:Flagellar hook-basal body complex protein FliE n=1 Tax=Caulobacter mirabilis TaxID=69666 RepID=A0A2D2AVE0_9CAUL|nr:flagellar hook-basal body complex protein FliE [Caulobacter mirabilis]ATQ41980.1 flagellar hook-basal body complex protein FliE [Caulobacter mirabilis]